MTRLRSPSLRRRRPPLFGVLALPVLALAVAAALAAQEPDPPAIGETFVESVEVEIVDIDVHVTDADGRPVRGLGPEDFTVFRDGEPVPIANFYAVEGGRERDAEARSPAVADEAPPRRLWERMPPLPPEHALWLVVYVDNLNLDPNERKRVMPEVRQFVTRMVADGHQVMVASFDRSLHVVQPFTTDLARLEAALDEVEDKTGFAAQRDRERADVLHRIDRADDPYQALNWARNYADAQRLEVEDGIAGLRRQLESLAGLPGRKALLHVSSGIPMNAGEGVFHAVAERFGDSRAYSEIPRYSTSRQFTAVARAANASRVAFYELDATGLRGMTFGAAEYDDFVSGRMRTVLDSVVPENLQSPLRLLAEETGGVAILNQNEVMPPLLDAAAAFGDFYSLGIASAGDDDGRYHDIEVRVAGTKARRVRHRAGYESRSRDARLADRVRSALVHPVPETDGLGLEVAWGRPVAEERDLWVVPFQLRIPLDRVTWLPVAGDRRELRLKLYVATMDEGGRVSAVDRVPFGLRIAEADLAAARGESYLYVHRLRVDGGRQRVVVAVVDELGGELSLVGRNLVVGPDAG